jgi:hypothetical protein
MRLPDAVCFRPALLALALTAPALTTIACGFESRGLRDLDGGVRDARPDLPPIISTGTVTLPRAGARSMAVWTSAGGGAVTTAKGAVGVTITCPATTSSVAAPGGATVTIGHFADTLE